jgi:hypothetical protein
LTIWGCRFSTTKLAKDDKRTITKKAFFEKNNFHSHDKHRHPLDIQEDGDANFSF